MLGSNVKVDILPKPDAPGFDLYIVLVQFQAFFSPCPSSPQVVDALEVWEDLPGVGEEVWEDVVGVPRALQHVREEDVEVGGEVLHVHAELAERHVRLRKSSGNLGKPSHTNHIQLNFVVQRRLILS